ncbi:MAG TPA: tRNA uridine-5-carboxymethylaminomethyl(34) synthesis enzyme MnmG [Oscillospiraceae bacterium]|nr:tRNA uridine-5-carboxymethylaminomethyl(34) synthesis enzyme MnmG [Oscillospiraceae bacterium]HPS34548.1 tRNA uridine-5-carboxymethylaminomethyl(34) synthesis enzyme MnmG [Oscillospiraceae bacterium]
MIEYHAGKIDVAVVGAGHAGIEAALAAARLGCETVLFTLNLDAVANMPCNPSIGGTGKGQLVRELDALGGQMGKSADEVCLQSRMLNLGKGPAVRSLRMQSDRPRYKTLMKKIIEQQPRLQLVQAEITAVEYTEDNHLILKTGLGAIYHTKSVVIAAGTYLKGKIHIGEVNYEAGPDNMRAASGLSDSLKTLGIRMLRFKTGTPARADGKSIDYNALERQEGDRPPEAFSYDTDPAALRNDFPCYIAWTNEKTHEIIRKNLHRSPLYGGVIEGIGPRYCPSIEDKVVRFADKTRHQIFIEPTAAESCEVYIQGMSSSLPEEVQLEFLRTIKGFEHIKIMRTAYAIEYDCCDPIQLAPTLEFKDFPGIFGAGQFNGTSGYEEAAVQGFVAGVNAANKILGKPEFILSRENSYIGTLIDDIVTKGVVDPYRMMTSRCEYRLVVRQDNADLRMTPLGRELGLIDDDRWARFLKKKEQLESERRRVRETTIKHSPELNALLEQTGSLPLSGGIRLSELLKRPQISYADLAPFDPSRPLLPEDIGNEIDIEYKYEGYIRIQQERIEELRRIAVKKLPPDVDYKTVGGLRLEAKEKLNKIKPRDLGQASRISGVTPADLAVLSVWLVKQSKEANSFQKDLAVERADEK